MTTSSRAGIHCSPSVGRELTTRALHPRHSHRRSIARGGATLEITGRAAPARGWIFTAKSLQEKSPTIACGRSTTLRRAGYDGFYASVLAPGPVVRTIYNLSRGQVGLTHAEFARRAMAIRLGRCFREHVSRHSTAAGGGPRTRTRPCAFWKAAPRVPSLSTASALVGRAPVAVSLFCYSTFSPRPS